MEHPDVPPEPTAPPSFLLDEVRFLTEQFPQADTIRLDQGAVGAPTVKPTRFVAVNCPQVAEAFSRMPTQGKCVSARGFSSLTGIDDDDHCRTAGAKQYGAGLVAGFLEAVCQLARTSWLRPRLLMSTLSMPLMPTFCASRRLWIRTVMFSNGEPLRATLLLVLFLMPGPLHGAP